VFDERPARRIKARASQFPGGLAVERGPRAAVRGYVQEFSRYPTAPVWHGEGQCEAAAQHRVDRAGRRLFRVSRHASRAVERTVALKERVPVSRLASYTNDDNFGDPRSCRQSENLTRFLTRTLDWTPRDRK
jgi:hypothetical protein